MKIITPFDCLFKGKPMTNDTGRERMDDEELDGIFREYMQNPYRDACVIKVFEQFKEARARESELGKVVERSKNYQNDINEEITRQRVFEENEELTRQLAELREKFNYQKDSADQWRVELRQSEKENAALKKRLENLEMTHISCNFCTDLVSLKDWKEGKHRCFNGR